MHSSIVNDPKGDHPMVTDYGRNQLVREYQRKPASAVRLLLTCAAGLLMVFVLAVAGAYIENLTYENSPTQTANQTR
jgi:hypothetical protein